MPKTGRLDKNVETKLALILGILRQNPMYYVDEHPMVAGDLSRIVGKVVEVKLRWRSEEIIRIRTHYEGDKKRIAVISDSYNRRLESYDHGIESLDEFLKEECYERVVHASGKDKKKKGQKGKVF